MSSGPTSGPCSNADSSEMKQAFFARPFNSSKTTFLTSPDSPAFCSFMRRFLYLPIRASYVRTESLAHTFFFLILPTGRVSVGKREEKRDGTDLTNGLHYPPDSVTGSYIRVPSRLL